MCVCMYAHTCINENYALDHTVFILKRIVALYFQTVICCLVVK